MSEQKVIELFGGTPARELLEVLVSSQATRNSFCLVAQTSPPGGGGITPHNHDREDEVFLVLEGEYELLDNGQWVPLRQGEPQFKLRGEVHAFRNSGTTPGRILLLTTPGGLDDFFEVISSLAMPQDLNRLMDVAKMFGITFSAPAASP